MFDETVGIGLDSVNDGKNHLIAVRYEEQFKQWTVYSDGKEQISLYSNQIYGDPASSEFKVAPVIKDFHFSGRITCLKFSFTK